MNWIAVLLLSAHILLANMPHSPLALTGLLPQQAGVEVEDQGVTYQFGESLTFNAHLETDSPVSEVLLVITPAGESPVMQPVTVNADNSIEQTVDARQLALRPFSENSYQYQVTLQDGTIVSSPTFTFPYDDTRYRWQALTDEDFEVYWYGRDSSFGQEVLNVAREGLEQADSILPVDAPRPIRIYVYASSRDLLSAYQNNHTWVAGQASPDLNMTAISIPEGPEQMLELERQVPHEIMHILQYQLVGDNYRRQPAWLLEGMASITELYPNPEYERVLAAKAASNELIPMTTLCTPFGREASTAFQSYAQSESFVRFLYQKFGTSGLRSLMDQYNNGVGCEEGVSAALGVSMGQIEYLWKQEALGVNAGRLVLRNLAPYLLLLVLLLVPAVIVLFPFTRSKEGKTATFTS